MQEEPARASDSHRLPGQWSTKHAWGYSAETIHEEKMHINSVKGVRQQTSHAVRRRAVKKDDAKGLRPTRRVNHLQGFFGANDREIRKDGRFQEDSTPSSRRYLPELQPRKEPTSQLACERGKGNNLGGHMASERTQTVYIMPGGIPPIPPMPPMPPAPGGGPISDGLVFLDAITSSILRIIDATSVAD